MTCALGNNSNGENQTIYLMYLISLLNIPDLLKNFFYLRIKLQPFRLFGSPLLSQRSQSSPPSPLHCFSRGKKTAVSIAALPMLPPLCSLLINRDFAWLNFKRPLNKKKKKTLLGHESFDLSSEL